MWTTSDLQWLWQYKQIHNDGLGLMNWR